MIGIYGVNSVAKLAIDILRSTTSLGEVTLIDDDQKKSGEVFYQKKVGYSLNAWKTQFASNSEAFIFLAIGEKHLARRHEVFHSIPIARFMNIIDPRSFIAEDASLGTGNLFARFSSIGHETKIGHNCIIWTAAIIEHNTEIGDSCYISPNVTISGNCRLGRCTLVGSGAVLLPGVTVGNHCIVGAGAVVTKSVPDNTVVKGNPAKMIQHNSHSHE